ncbi:MAG: cytochrome c-type biogenesis protein [Candidatus Acidiferrales bacterium]
MKRGQISLVFLAALFTLGIPTSAQQTPRAKSLGERMLCMCGCNQVLTQCNHVGCPSLTSMMQELDQRVARNESDDLTLQAFVQEYGEKVLSSPRTQGFGLTAWVMPIVVVLVGLMVIWMVLERWRKRALAAPAAHVSPEMLARAQRETNREDDN